jgi:outer membrane protein assembly factor BamA
VKFSSETAEFLKSKPEIFTKNLDSLKQVINQKYTDEGFAFNRVKTQFLGFENDVPKVEISVFKGDKRGSMVLFCKDSPKFRNVLSRI